MSGSLEPTGRSATGVTLLLAMVVLALASAMARAGDASCWDAVGRLPGDVRTVVCFQSPAEVLRSEQGRRLVSTLARAGVTEATASAWRDLAATLEADPDALIDELLGGRLLIAVGETDPLRAAEAPWVVLAEIGAESERRLLRRLRPAPRQTLAGQPVLSVEHGRYEMVILRPGRRFKNGRNSVAVLGPAARSEVFEAVVASMADRGRGGRLSDTRAFVDAVSLGDGAVLALHIARGAEGERDGHVALRAERRNGGWAADVRATPGMLGVCPEERGGVPASLPTDFSVEPWSDAVLVFAGRRLSLEASGEGDALLDSIAPDLGALNGRGALIVVHMSEAAQRDAGVLSVTYATRVGHEEGWSHADADRELVTLARSGTEFAARAQGGGVGSGYAGLFPSAVRVHRVARSAEVWTRLFGPSPSMAWTYVEPGGAGGAGAWLVLHLGNGPAPVLSRTREAARSLGAAHGHGTDDLLAAGTLRPNRIGRMLGEPTPAGEVLQGFELVSWRLRLDENGGDPRIGGRIELEFSGPAGDGDRR